MGTNESPTNHRTHSATGGDTGGKSTGIRGASQWFLPSCPHADCKDPDFQGCPTPPCLGRHWVTPGTGRALVVMLSHPCGAAGPFIQPGAAWCPAVPSLPHCSFSIAHFDKCFRKTNSPFCFFPPFVFPAPSLTHSNPPGAQNHPCPPGCRRCAHSSQTPLPSPPRHTCRDSKLSPSTTRLPAISMPPYQAVRLS